MSRTFGVRPYIGVESLSIDGRRIPYPLVNDRDYIMAKNLGMTDEEYDEYADNRPEQLQMLNAIIAMKQSYVLLRHTAYSCDSLSESLNQHKKEIVERYNEMYPDEPFDESFYDHYGEHISVEHESLRDIDYSDMKVPMAVIYNKPLDFPDKFVVRVMDAINGGVALTNAIIARDSLRECREELYGAGFCIPIPRCAEDDGCIVETWIKTGR